MIGSLIDKLYELRIRKEELNSSLSELNKEIDSLEYDIIRKMEEAGVDKTSTGSATVTRKVELYPQVEDISALVEWAAANGRPEILQKRVSKSVFDEIFKEEGLYPDGVKTYNKESLLFRKAKGGK